jgi:hypothetical protein
LLSSLSFARMWPCSILICLAETVSPVAKSAQETRPGVESNHPDLTQERRALLTQRLAWVSQDTSSRTAQSSRSSAPFHAVAAGP